MTRISQMWRWVSILKKAKALEAVANLLKGVSSNSNIIPKNVQKIKKYAYSLRRAKKINYSIHLEDNNSIVYSNKKLFKHPSKPRFTLDDKISFDLNAFIVAILNLKHNIQTVYARKAIPLKLTSRILYNKNRYENKYIWYFMVASKGSLSRSERSGPPEFFETDFDGWIVFMKAHLDRYDRGKFSNWG